MAEGIEAGHADQQCLLSPQVRHGVHTRPDGLGGALDADQLVFAAICSAADTMRVSFMMNAAMSGPAQAAFGKLWRVCKRREGRSQPLIRQPARL